MATDTPSAAAPPTLLCQTITSLWRFGRAIYRLGPLVMPVPIPWVSALYVLAALVPIWAAANLVNVPFANFGLTLRFVLPFAIAAYCVRLASNGQKPSEVVRSWVRITWFLARKRGSSRRPTRLRSAPVTRLAPVPVRVRSRARCPR